MKEKHRIAQIEQSRAETRRFPLVVVENSQNTVSGIIDLQRKDSVVETQTDVYLYS